MKNTAEASEKLEIQYIHYIGQNTESKAKFLLSWFEEQIYSGQKEESCYFCKPAVSSWLRKRYISSFKPIDEIGNSVTESSIAELVYINDRKRLVFKTYPKLLLVNSSKDRLPLKEQVSLCLVEDPGYGGIDNIEDRVLKI